MLEFINSRKRFSSGIQLCRMQLFHIIRRYVVTDYRRPNYNLFSTSSQLWCVDICTVVVCALAIHKNSLPENILQNNQFGHFRLELVTLILIKTDEFVQLHCIRNCVSYRTIRNHSFSCAMCIWHILAE